MMIVLSYVKYTIFCSITGGLLLTGQCKYDIYVPSLKMLRLIYNTEQLSICMYTDMAIRNL